MILVHKFLIALISLRVILFSSFLPGKSAEKTIKIAYATDGELQEVYNKSKLFFIYERDTLEAEIDSLNYLRLPSVFTENTYDIVFMYKKDTLTFKDFDVQYIYQDQDFEWRFETDYRPFENTGVPSYHEFLTDTITKKLTSWHFNPQENGCGVFIYNKIN
jgi:hypothetical protein